LAAGVTIFCQQVLQRRVVEHGFGQQFLQPGVMTPSQVADAEKLAREWKPTKQSHSDNAVAARTLSDPLFDT